MKMIINNNRITFFSSPISPKNFKSDTEEIKNFIIELINNSNKNFKWHHLLNISKIKTISNHDLISILSFIENQQNNHISHKVKDTLLRIGFEIKHAIYSRAWNNLNNENELIDESNKIGMHKLADELRNITLSSPVLPIRCNVDNGIRSTQDFFLKTTMDSIQPYTSLDINPEKPRVLVISLEYEGACVGGVGAVANGLLFAMNKENQDAKIITPLYNTYISDYNNDLKFVCFVDHPYQGQWIQSSVYSTKTQNGTVTQYFVKPPESMQKINDIGTPKDVYITNKDTDFVSRSIYFNAAAVAFGASYVGQDKKSPFQILHSNSWILGFTGALLTKHYNPMRKQAGINCRLAHVAHIHSTGNFEQGRYIRSSIYDDLGLVKPKGLDYAFVNMQAHTYASSADCDIHVSNWAAESSLTKKGGYDLEKFVQERTKQGRLFGIRNGIIFESHSPLLSKNYSQYSYKQSITNGIDTTDYISQRNNVKTKLFKEKLIADPTKPLFLFVGRFDIRTKGIDTLPAMVEQIHKDGGQCVVMGTPTGSIESELVIKTLKKFQRKHPETLKVYTNRETDQKENVKDTTVPKGNLIRLASDFVMVPSHREADGIVPKESLACGSLIVTSGVEGLSDTARGLGDTWNNRVITKEEFNAFTYKNNFRFKANAKKAVSASLKFFKTSSHEEKNKIISRIIKESEIFNWKESVEKVNQVYKKAMQEPTEEEISSMKKIEEKFYKRNFNILVFAFTSLKKLKNKLKYLFSRISTIFSKTKPFPQEFFQH